MTRLIISPNGSASIIVGVYEWSNKDQKDVLIGAFKISGRADGIEVETEKNWKTHQRNPLKGYYYLNEPSFQKVEFEPFQGVCLTEVREVLDDEKEKK